MDDAITEAEVLEALKHASNKKAPGPDKLPNEFWKNFHQAIPIMTKEFNAILESGEIPEEWQTSETVMLHKKGSHGEYYQMGKATIVP